MATVHQLFLNRSHMNGTQSVYSSTLSSATVVEKNPKSQLMEFFQKRPGVPQFSTSATSKPPAEPSFKCYLTCPSVQAPLCSEESTITNTVFEGIGRNKKLAEQAACLEALEFYRSKRVIGNFRPPQTSSPVQSQAAVTNEQAYPHPSPTPVPSAASDVYMHPIQQPILNGVSHRMMPSVVQAPPPTAVTQAGQVIPGIGGIQLVHQPMQSVVEDYQTDMGMDEFDMDESIAVDNDDIERRKKNILRTNDVEDLRQWAFEAVEEIIQLRQGLFDAQQCLKHLKNLGDKVVGAANYGLRD